MDILAALRVFVRVAEAHSFSAVARELGTTQPAISRQVAALEEHLGARLLQRTTRSLALTEDGRDLLGHARRVMDSVEEAEAAVGRRHAAPGGLVKLATSASFGRLFVAPRIPLLLGRYPELAVELHMGELVVDLVTEGIDLAIRVAPTQDSSLVTRTIGTTRSVTVASPDCIARHGQPEHPADLAHLPCVIFLGRASPTTWRFERNGEHVSVEVGGRFRTDNGEAVREAVFAGLGFAVLPTWFIEGGVAASGLCPVLPGWEPPPGAVSAVYPTRRNLAPRTRAVIDFFVEEFRADPAFPA